LGRGKADARLLIVGEYPRGSDAGQWSFGKEEDELLWKMMQAIGLGPKDVYLTNVVKCSPSGEQHPLAEHELACQGYLFQEIAQVQPAVILAMGKAAARAILGSDVSLFRLRGRLHATRFTGATGAPIPVMISFHPGFLLEQPAMKRAAWQDLQIVQRQLQQAESGVP
jgi:DNA polymerase